LGGWGETPEGEPLGKRGTEWEKQGEGGRQRERPADTSADFENLVYSGSRSVPRKKQAGRSGQATKGVPFAQRAPDREGEGEGEGQGQRVREEGRQRG
jgi:hypothetical protein